MNAKMFLKIKIIFIRYSFKWNDFFKNCQFSLISTIILIANYAKNSKFKFKRKTFDRTTTHKKSFCCCFVRFVKLNVLTKGISPLVEGKWRI